MSAKVFHIPLIATVPELKLYAIVQRNPKSDDDAEKDHSGIKRYHSTEDMVKDDNVDAVIVTTPPATHLELAKLALENGKHVVVEKPFTPTHEEATELISVAKKHQRLLTVYQNRRWDSDFLTISDLVKKGSLGRITEFETHFDRHRPEVPSGGGWKTKPAPGGGAVFDLGTHLIDQVVVLFGLPKRITGFVGTQRENSEHGLEDSCTVLLHYHGMLATVKAAVVSPEVNQLRYWVRGTKGSYKKFHLDCQEDHLKAGKKPGEEGFGVEPKERYGTLTVANGTSISEEVYPTLDPITYRAFYTKFAEALAGQGEIPVEPEAPAAVIRLIELARQSSKEGRTVDV